jgi:spermidine synthase
VRSPVVDNPPRTGSGVRGIRLALWLATAFLTGAVIMAQELLAFRLYAPYFGYSIYVWGSMISVVLAALAAGYALGGLIADRSQSDLPLYCTIFASALYQLGILFTLYPLLRIFTRLGDSTGAALASLVIFAPPMTAMATASPFLVRLLGQSGRIGWTAGKIYALSTIGSIAGILGTSFLLVPHFGTHKTLEGICLLSAVIAVAGLAVHFRFAWLALVLIAVIAKFVPPQLWPASTLWAADSPYNLVRVIRNGNWLILKLNDEMGVHTIRDERTGWTGHYYDEFALGPLLCPAKQLLVLGLGGGASIASTRVTAPDVVVDAVEIDSKVVEAATRYFGVNSQDDKLRVYVADARPWLAGNRNTYDLVHVDLYQGGPYIPFYLVTREFFEAVREHMSPDGLLMMNLFDGSRNQELLRPTVATLHQVFPSVMVLPTGFGNHMLIAFPRETSEAAVRGRLASFKGNPAVERLARVAQKQISIPDIPAGTLVFSDDFAPVEAITRRILRGN